MTSERSLRLAAFTAVLAAGCSGGAAEPTEGGQPAVEPVDTAEATPSDGPLPADRRVGPDLDAWRRGRPSPGWTRVSPVLEERSHREEPPLEVTVYVEGRPVTGTPVVLPASQPTCVGVVFRIKDEGWQFVPPVHGGDLYVVTDSCAWPLPESEATAAEVIPLSRRRAGQFTGRVTLDVFRRSDDGGLVDGTVSGGSALRRGIGEGGRTLQVVGPLYPPRVAGESTLEVRFWDERRFDRGGASRGLPDRSWRLAVVFRD